MITTVKAIKTRKGILIGRIVQCDCCSATWFEQRKHAKTRDAAINYGGVSKCSCS